MIFSTVVDGGYCIGCGACAAADSSGLVSIRFDPRYGRMQAHLESPYDTMIPSLDFLSHVCPFGSSATNETEIARSLYGTAQLTQDDRIGYYTTLYAGHATEGTFRSDGSSGGLTSWLLCELHARGLIDGVIHVRPTEHDPDGLLFRYGISTTPEDIRHSAKSRYYPVEMSRVLQQVQDTPGRYAVVGVPCFIKAIRLLMRTNSVFAERISFTVAIVCGHLKSTRFADMLAWQLGISPGDLTAIDFRTKILGAKSSDYGVTVQGSSDNLPVAKSTSVRDSFGSNWGYGFFKYEACDYCDDVVGETADISFGDAWLPKYVDDCNGTNIVIVRNATLSTLLLEATRAQRIHLDTITAEDVFESQAGGFRHRRGGLAYRLYLKKKSGKWHPPKRIDPAETLLTTSEKKIIESRLRLAKQSHEAFVAALDTNSFGLFKSMMQPLMSAHDALHKTSPHRKVLHAIRQRRVAAATSRVLHRLWDTIVAWTSKQM